MENKIGEIVTLPPYDIKARVEEAPTDECEGCYYNGQTSLCEEYKYHGVRVLGYCFWMNRKDHKNIIYKPLTEEEE